MYAQKQQRDRTDARHPRAIEKPLEAGTIVFLKVPGLLATGKLEEKYFGPCTIHAISSRGNYWLQNEDGNLLKNSYPITKLKIIEVNKKQNFVMEEVRDMKIVNNKRTYFVKWKDHDKNKIGRKPIR